MRKISLFISLILLFGCEKYELITPPAVSGGKWVLYDYEVVPFNSISPYDVIKNDTICINSWNNQTFVSGGILMKQNFNNTSKDRRFVIGKTTWEFDGTVGSSRYYLTTEFKNFGGTPQSTHVPFEVTVYNRTNKLNVYNTEIGATTYYTYDVNDYKSNGVTPVNKMTLLGTEVVTDLYLSNGTRDKALTVRILLKFMR